MNRFFRNFTIPTFLAMGLLLNSCSFSSQSTKKMLVQAKKHSYDVIVVPGVPLENGQWSDVMKARVYWSKFLFDKGIAKNIMYSGGAVYTPYVEAEVMKLYAIAIGIPAQNIYTETKAEHSTENIYYSYKKAKLMNFENIALASDPFQSKMLKRFIRSKVSNDVAIIPIVFDTLRKMEPMMINPELIFEPVNNENFVALPERKGFFTRLRGTMGKSIDETAYD